MRSFLMLLCLLLLASCSTIIKGTSQAITFTSTPSGAEVLIDGVSMGVTPLTVKLKKNKYSTVLIKKVGYYAQTKPIDKEYDPTTLFNITWDSSTTDFITGAAYEYEPNHYNFMLERDLGEAKK